MKEPKMLTEVCMRERLRRGQAFGMVVAQEPIKQIKGLVRRVRPAVGRNEPCPGQLRVAARLTQHVNADVSVTMNWEREKSRKSAIGIIRAARQKSAAELLSRRAGKNARTSRALRDCRSGRRARRSRGSARKRLCRAP